VSDPNDEASPEPWSAAVHDAPTGGAGFLAHLKAATPRVFVTYVIALACLAVYVAMILSGASPWAPNGVTLLAWGANFGPFVVNDHQEWRLFTNLFVHGGFLHLALNLWCLLSVGPLVERLYGNLGFAALYLMAGLGASIASIMWHPLMPSAGASGAIFGVYGALAAFLVVHRDVIPTLILKPLRSSTFSFIGYNLIVGAMDRRIDSAAHIGGLVTGFVVGLLIRRPWPVSSGGNAVVRRVVSGGLAAIGLFVAYRGVQAAIRAHPEVAQVSLAGDRAGAALNRFIDQARPLMEDFDRIDRDLVRIIEQLRRPNPPPPALVPDKAAIGKKLAELAGRSEAGRRRLDQIPIEGQELDTMRQGLSRGFAGQEQALLALRRAVETDDATHMSGPEGFNRHRKDSQDQLNAYASALQDYARKYHLKLAPR
jgi:rhomboid protease GluP